jgi:IS30 family transposase
VSHETIYRNVFNQARGALKKELLDQLRSKRGMRVRSVKRLELHSPKCRMLNQLSTGRLLENSAAVYRDEK